DFQATWAAGIGVVSLESIAGERLPSTPTSVNLHSHATGNHFMGTDVSSWADVNVEAVAKRKRIRCLANGLVTLPTAFASLSLGHTRPLTERGHPFEHDTRAHGLL